MTPHSVDVGKAVISASLRWNNTGITLVNGERYLITAHRSWVDFFLCHGPAGDPGRGYMRLFDHHKRMPNENWFALIGALDCNPNTAFFIGKERDITIQVAGQLTCFANDVSSMYWNTGVMWSYL
jgi:hypothetical protein